MSEIDNLYTLTDTIRLGDIEFFCYVIRLDGGRMRHYLHVECPSLGQGVVMDMRTEKREVMLKQVDSVARNLACSMLMTAGEETIGSYRLDGS